jgi:transcriptional regulator with XRE-family HTH domain
MSEDAPRYPTPALELLRAKTKDLTQAQIAPLLGCSQAMVSEYLGGRSRPGPIGRALAERSFGVPIAAWFLPSELPAVSSVPTQSETGCEAPQAAHAPPGPAFSADAAPVWA